MMAQCYTCRRLYHGNNQVVLLNQRNCQWQVPGLDAKGNLPRWETELIDEQVFNIPVIYLNDEVTESISIAKQAAKEFSKVLCQFGSLCPKPLEQAPLDPDVVAILLKDKDQHLVSF